MTSKTPRTVRWAVPLLFAGLGLTGCGPADTASFGAEHRSTAEQRPTELGLGQRERFGFQDMRGTAAKSGAGGGAQFAADAPANWQLQAPDPSRFRDLRWFLDGDSNAECYLTAAVGGSLSDNVGRWYGQFGLQMPGMADILALPQHSLGGAPALFLELTGTFRGAADTRMMILIAHEGGMLRSTFRCTAPKAIAERERDNFLQVAASIRSGGGAAAAGAEQGPPGPPPAGGEPNPHGTDPMADPHGGAMAAMTAPFTATVPADWTAMGDTSSRLLRYRFGTAGECYTGQLGGDLAMMLGIWCGEMQAPTPDAAGIAALPKVPLLGAEAVLLDLTGDHEGMGGARIPAARLLVAVASTGNGIVFAKCLGPAAEVEAVRPAFLKYCETLRRTDR